MGEFRVGGRRRGGEDVVPGAADAESMVASLDSGASSGSLCSSIMSSLTDDDDDAESSLVAGDPTPSPPSDAMRLDGGGGGPLYELSPLLAHLPVRASQQDDNEEDGAEGLIGPGAVKSMEQGLSAQKR
uniref:Uncharacterized protein n=1 Tax=Aegilops tauschii TaxID=37682 RepID=N1QVZ4_AEGTA